MGTKVCSDNSVSKAIGNSLRWHENRLYLSLECLVEGYQEHTWL